MDEGAKLQISHITSWVRILLPMLSLSCIIESCVFHRDDTKTHGENMLETILIILLILWLLGMIGGVGGGLIHVLIVIALVLFIVRMIPSKRPPQ